MATRVTVHVKVARNSGDRTNCYVEVSAGSEAELAEGFRDIVASLDIMKRGGQLLYVREIGWGYRGTAKSIARDVWAKMTAANSPYCILDDS